MARTASSVVAAVRELPAHVRADARDLAALQRLLLVRARGEGERPLEHDVDLLLALVAVDAAALARAVAQQVEAEGAHAELAPEGLEAAVAVELDPRRRDAVARCRSGRR